MMAPCKGLARQSVSASESATSKSAADSIPSVFLGLKTYTLKNGIRVVVYEHHRAPVIMLLTCVQTGSADESHGKTGIAHFTEHLMFKGTKTAPLGTFEQIMDTHGIQWNAYTGHDLTAFMELTHKEHLERCMQLEADRFAHLDVFPKDFEKERLVVLEELKIGASSDAEVLDRRARYNLFTNHPYGREVGGFPGDVKSLSWDDVRNFRAVHYVPKNIVLMIAGDITAEEAFRLAEKHYGSLPGTDPQERRWVNREARQNEEVRITKRSNQTKQSVLTFYWYVPCLHDEQTRAASLELACKWLGQGKTSYLYRKLVEEQEVASSISCEADVSMREGGTLVIRAVPCPNISIETLEKRLRACLAQCSEENADLSKGATLLDLENVKQKFAATIPFIQDNFRQAAMLVASLLCAGHSSDFIDRYPALIEAVSLDDFRAALKDMGKPPEDVTILLPEETK